MARLFGTDGVRGLAGGPVLTAELATAVAASAATVLLEAGPGGERPLVVVGRDTRPSGRDARSRCGGRLHRRRV